MYKFCLLFSTFWLLVCQVNGKILIISLYSTILISLFSVSLGGSPSYPVCENYIESFNPVLHDALQSLIRSYTDCKAMMHAVNISLPTDIYFDELKKFSDPWHDDNFSVINDVMNFASALTGFPNEYIFDAFSGITSNSEFPASCLISQLRELSDQFFSLESSLNEQRDLFKESNIRVKKAQSDDDEDLKDDGSEIQHD